MSNRVSAVALNLEPNSIAAHLAGHERVLLFGQPGSGKSTLAAKLAAVFAERGVTCACVGADPGSPAFGVPGAVCLGRWTANGWVSRMWSLFAAWMQDDFGSR